MRENADRRSPASFARVAETRQSIFSWTRGREKGEAFQQPLDVRIRTLEAVQAESTGDLGKVAREFTA